MVSQPSTLRFVKIEDLSQIPAPTSFYLRSVMENLPSSLPQPIPISFIISLPSRLIPLFCCQTQEFQQNSTLTLFPRSNKARTSFLHSSPTFTPANPILMKIGAPSSTRSQL